MENLGDRLEVCQEWSHRSFHHSASSVLVCSEVRQNEKRYLLAINVKFGSRDRFLAIENSDLQNHIILGLGVPLRADTGENHIQAAVGDVAMRSDRTVPPHDPI